MRPEQSGWHGEQSIRPPTHSRQANRPQHSSRDFHHRGQPPNFSYSAPTSNPGPIPHRQGSWRPPWTSKLGRNEHALSVSFEGEKSSTKDDFAGGWVSGYHTIQEQEEMRRTRRLQVDQVGSSCTGSRSLLMTWVETSGRPDALSN